MAVSRRRYRRLVKHVVVALQWTVQILWRSVRFDARMHWNRKIIAHWKAAMTNKSLTLHIVAVVRTGAASAHANGDAHDARANDQQTADRD